MAAYTLRSGMVARYDAFTSGLVPCRVLSIAGQPNDLLADVRILVTRKRGPYKAGDVINTHALHVLPVRAIRRRRYSTVIRPYAVVPGP